MSRYKDKMIGIHAEFFSCLNDDGMTNEQAIAKIKKDHGEHWEEYVRDIIAEEECAHVSISQTY